MKSRLIQFGINLIRSVVNLMVDFMYLATVISQPKRTRAGRPLDQMKKVLLINLSRIGDVIRTTPAIRAIKKSYPHLHVTMVVDYQSKEVIMGNPHIDRIIAYDDRSWRDFLGVKKKIRSENFDLSILFFGRIKGSLLALMSGAKNYSGFLNNNLYEIKKFGPLLAPAGIMVDRKEPLAKRQLKVVESIGCNDSDTNLEIFLQAEEDKYVDKLWHSFGITGDDLVICFNPETNWDCRKWGEEKFARLGDFLYEICGSKIVISGSSKGIETVQRIALLMRTKPIILAGKTTITQLAAALKRCDLLVTVDSAPLHIAQAVGTPTITLFGPTDYQVVLPQNEKNIAIWKPIPCSPCYNGLHQPICDNYKCMDSIIVDDVLRAVDAQFKKEELTFGEKALGVIDKSALPG